MINTHKKELLDDLIALVVQPSGSSPIYNCSLSIKDMKRGVSYLKTMGSFDKNDTPINPSVQFRIGSITKPFTATLILQLVEEGIFALSSRYLDLVSSNTKLILKNLLQIDAKDCSGHITVEQLLSHQSGLMDYYSDDERFVELIQKHPDQTWKWQLIMEKYFEFDLNKKSSIQPGNGSKYADTNYLLLAVLIEDIYNLPFHQVLEKKILKPLGLSETYLEFYQKKKGIVPMAYPFHGTTNLKEVNTSFDWGGGGIVSTLADLQAFLQALVMGHLFKLPSTLHKMLTITKPAPYHESSINRTPYSLGLQQKNIGGFNFVGHTSAYGAMAFCEPINKMAIVVSVNQTSAMHKAEWLMLKALKVYMS